MNFFKEIKIKLVSDSSSITINTTNSTTEVKKEIPPVSYIQNLGKGTEGIVDLYKDNIKQRLFAMKTVSYEGMSEAEKTKLRVSETEMLEKVRGPTIIEFYGANEDSKARYISLEYAPGGTLDDLIKGLKRGGCIEYTDQDKLNWLVQMLIALYTLHSHNMMHRDIKPENILLSDNGLPDIPKNNKEKMIAKISDLGISKIIQGFGQHTVTGTAFYTAPEILSYLPYDKNVDIWSMGVLLFELATKFRPFQSFDMTKLYEEIKSQEINPLPDSLDYRIRYLIDHILVKNPKRRITLEEIFSLDFIRKILDDNLKRFPAWKEEEGVKSILKLPITQCIYQETYLVEEDWKLFLDCLRISSTEGCDKSTYKLGLLKGSVETYRGADLEDYISENLLKEIDSNKKEEKCEEFLEKILGKGLLLPVSGSSTAFSSSTHYSFAYDAKHRVKFDNRRIGNNEELKLANETIDLLLLSRHILLVGKRIAIRYLDEENEPEENDLLECSKDYALFLHSVSLFKTFNITDEPSKSFTSDDRHAFLLNLYQIMFVHNLLNEALDRKNKKGIFSMFNNDVSINYEFADCTFNNLELKHGIFRDNKKPIENYMKIMYDNDKRRNIAKGLKFNAIDHIITPEFINSSKYNRLQVFSSKDLANQIAEFSIRYTQEIISFVDDGIVLPKYIEKYVATDFDGNIIRSLFKMINKAVEANQIKEEDKEMIYKVRFSNDFFESFTDVYKNIKKKTITYEFI